MNNRTCIDCIHWWFDSGSPDWSEVTPGENWSSYCRGQNPSGKSHWQDDGYDETHQTFRAKLLTARSCKDFTPYPAETEVKP